jgi:hypothetical protein
VTIDDRLRGAFDDLQQRADRLAPPALEPRPTGRRSLVPLLATAAVVTAIASAAWLGGGRGEVPPIDRPTTATTATTSSTTQPTSASQSPEDALRDGVVPELAALPFQQRVRVIDPISGDVSVSTDEGVWVVSRLAFEDFPNGACLGSGDTPMTRWCPDDGELLLLDPAEDRILRAFPLPAYPPQWLFVTEDAVYCGRQGDGGLPNSMLCRVDRNSDELTVRAFVWTGGPDEPDDYDLPHDELPGTWTVDMSAATNWKGMRVTGDGSLEVGDADLDAWTAIDPVSLEPLGLDLGGERWTLIGRTDRTGADAVTGSSVCGQPWDTMRPGGVLSSRTDVYAAEDGAVLTVFVVELTDFGEAFQLRKFAFASCVEGGNPVFDAQQPPLDLGWGTVDGGSEFTGAAAAVGGRFVMVEVVGTCDAADCPGRFDGVEGLARSAMEGVNG